MTVMYLALETASRLNGTLKFPAVKLKGLTFLPCTHAVRPPSDDWDALVGIVGIEGQLEIINLDRTSGNIVVSQSELSACDVPGHLADAFIYP
jgi:hypothetical protein